MASPMAVLAPQSTAQSLPTPQLLHRNNIISANRVHFRVGSHGFNLRRASRGKSSCRHSFTIVSMSKPPSSSSPSPPTINEALQESIREAEEVCAAEGGSGECAAAWDTVEELSAAISHKRDGEALTESKDPLEKFCKEAPEADECRVYED